MVTHILLCKFASVLQTVQVNVQAPVPQPPTQSLERSKHHGFTVVIAGLNATNRNEYVLKASCG